MRLKCHKIPLWGWKNSLVKLGKVLKIATFVKKMF